MKSMIRSKILCVILLFVCTTPLHGMRNVPAEPENWGILDEYGIDLLTGGFIVPTLETVAMTTIAALPQAMMYVPFKEALEHMVMMGMITSYLGLCVTSITFSLGLGAAIACNYHLRCPFFQWKKPTNIVSAAVLTCLMLKISRDILLHISST